MADDLRVDLDPIFDALGVPVTVTRPAPDEDPIDTTGVWITPDALGVETGLELERREPLRVLALLRADVPTLPTGTTILAAETLGGTPETWTVSGIARVRADEWWATVYGQRNIQRMTRR